MKLVSFQSSDGPKLGASIDDKVLDLQATYQAAVTDDALPALLSGMIAFLEGGQRAFDAADTCNQRSGGKFRESGLEYRSAPVTDS